MLNDCLPHPVGSVTIILDGGESLKTVFLLAVICFLGGVAAEDEVSEALRDLRSDDWFVRRSAQTRLERLARRCGDAIYEAFQKEKDPDTKARLLRILTAAEYVSPEARKEFAAITNQLMTTETERIEAAAVKIMGLLQAPRRPFRNIRGFLARFFGDKKPIRVGVTVVRAELSGDETLIVTLLIRNESCHAGWAPILSINATGRLAEKLQTASFLKPEVVCQNGERHRVPMLFPYVWLKPRQTVRLVLTGKPPVGQITFTVDEVSQDPPLVRLARLPAKVFPVAKVSATLKTEPLFIAPPPEGRYPDYLKLRVAGPRTVRPKQDFSLLFTAQVKWRWYLRRLRDCSLVVFVRKRNSLEKVCVVEKPVVNRNALLVMWAVRIKAPRKHGIYAYQAVVGKTLSGYEGGMWTPRHIVEVR